MKEKGVEHVRDFLKWQDGVSPLFLPKDMLVRRATTGPLVAIDRVTAMAAIERESAACLNCPLGRTRTRPVFGDGDVNARLMFIGEGPGQDEDLQGVPFVGRAGQLLTRIIENGLRIPRTAVYIANIVKCRPPQNREPLPDEATACIGYLRRQIALIRPEAIVLLGKTALRYLLDEEKMSIRDARERSFEYEGIPVFVTYHPSALLRNPAFKRPTWEDMKRVMTHLGLPVEG